MDIRLIMYYTLYNIIYNIEYITCNIYGGPEFRMVFLLLIHTPTAVESPASCTSITQLSSGLRENTLLSVVARCQRGRQGCTAPAAHRRVLR